MKRRELLAGIALAAKVTGAQQTGHGSLYIPAPHRVEDRTLLHDFMDEYAFVELVTSTPSLRITHIPVLLDRNASANGTILGHISRNNPQSAAFDGRQSAVIVFRGPHAYISPSWYAKTEAVPTWNFAAVHATGTPKPIVEKKAVRELLARLIQKFENRYSGSAYDFAKLPDSYVYGMIEGIAAFEMPIDSLEGKFKLGQERSEADKAGILEHLGSAKPDRSMHDLTAGFYGRAKKPE